MQRVCACMQGHQCEDACVWEYAHVQNCPLILVTWQCCWMFLRHGNSIWNTDGFKTWELRDGTMWQSWGVFFSKVLPQTWNKKKFYHTHTTLLRLQLTCWTGNTSSCSVDPILRVSLLNTGPGCFWLICDVTNRTHRKQETGTKFWAEGDFKWK